jgi:glutamine phosphoribosylpyrophosphate amidotransferase
MEFYEPSEVHIRIPSPPIQSPCYYAINLKNLDELIVRKFFTDVNNPTEIEMQQLAQHFNAQSINYLPID